MSQESASRFYNQANASQEASKAFLDKAKRLLHGAEREFYLSQGHFLAGIASVYVKLAEENSAGSEDTASIPQRTSKFVIGDAVRFDFAGYTSGQVLDYDGPFYYVVKPSGAEGARFKLTEESLRHA